MNEQHIPGKRFVARVDVIPQGSFQLFKAKPDTIHDGNIKPEDMEAVYNGDGPEADLFGPAIDHSIRKGGEHVIFLINDQDSSDDYNFGGLEEID